MSDSAHVAFDLGAESGRAILGRFDGNRVVLDEARRFLTPSVRLPDGLYWDALALLREVTETLSEAHANAVNVKSLGIDSWGVDFGLLDRAGGLIANPLSYRDGRGASAMGRALSQVSAAEIYATTGIQFLAINTLFQLVSLRESGRLDHAESMLLMPDLLAYWLTGVRMSEATNASTTQLLDVTNAAWALELIAGLGLPRGIFEHIVEPGALSGALLPHIARATGLPESTRLAVVASHDTASAVVATPLGSSSAAYISSGTWSLVGVERAGPTLTQRAQDGNLTNERGFDETIRLLKNVMGLWLVQECLREWAREGSLFENHEIVRMAEAVPSGPLFDPDLPELLVPGDMPRRIREVCARRGQPLGDAPAEIARAVFESLACRYRHVLDEIEQLTGQTIETVHVTGGGSRNVFLCQLTADITRRHVLAGPVEASALGNVLVQMHAFGEVCGLAEMREIVRASTDITPYEPDPDADRWGLLYDRFQTVINAEANAA